MPLHEYLGMTIDEYGSYVEEEEVLSLIIAAHRKKVHFPTLAKNEVYAMAARSNEAAKSLKLKEWLVKRGLWT